MKSKSKKIIVSFMVFVILLGNFNLESKAEVIGKRTWKGFVYTGFPETPEEEKEDCCLTILNYTGNKKELTIPTEIKGMKVVNVSSLSKAKNLKTLHIPNGVEVRYAIGDAPKLKKITVRKDNPEYSVKNNMLLNKKGTVLLGCPGGYTTLKVPNSVKRIDCECCYKMKIKKIEYGKNLKKIGDTAFYKCNHLKEVTIDKNVQSIGRRTFAECANLKKVVLKKNVKKIGEGAFYNCNNLKEIYIYNKNCKIYINSYYASRVIPDGTTIYGKKGSTAEQYAKKYKLKFVEIK